MNSIIFCYKIIFLQNKFKNYIIIINNYIKIYLYKKNIVNKFSCQATRTEMIIEIEHFPQCNALFTIKGQQLSPKPSYTHTHTHTLLVSLHTLMSLSNFLAHLLEEIFTKLAVKTLIILTSVCKPWLALITSDHFVQSHFSRYHLNPDNHLLLTHHPYHKTIIISPLNFVGTPAISTTPLPVSQNWIDESVITSTRLLSSTQTFVGSVNGLVCFSWPALRPTNVVIWNPATRRFKDILVPHLTFENLFMIMVAFGFDFVVKDFKIVCLYAFHPLSNLTCHIRMYSCNDNSWKELKPDSPLPFGLVGMYVTVKGNPYWKCLCNQLINEIWVKVNVETEVIQMFSGLQYVKNKATSALL